MQRFGSPALQVREGISLKLQFRGRICVLDAYLYPSGTTGLLRVSHVDARAPSGSDYNQAACISARDSPRGASAPWAASALAGAGCDTRPQTAA
jgi:hypothetical protein